MATKPKKSGYVASPLFNRIREILESAHASVARTINTTQVLVNWLIGREIVEEEQWGKKRADYGRKVLADLSGRLGREFGRGYSVDNLEAFRQFYLEYPHLISETASRNFNLPAISETVSRKSDEIDSAGAWQPGMLNPNLSWSHYRSLLREMRPNARAFYEIEAINNAWSVRELSRQISSLLFDRLAKSRDKKRLMRLALQGQEVARSIDVLKDPMVLEFLSLPESPRLVESKLEQALIGNLQTFFKRPEIQAAIVKAVEEQRAPGQMELEGVTEKPDIVAVVAKTVELVMQQTIDIPRILVVPRGEVQSGFKPFTLNLDALKYPAVSDELWIQALRTNEREVLALGRGGIKEARLEDYVVGGLVDFDDISYDEHADLLYDLATQTVRHFQSYLNDEDTRKVLRCYQRDIARFIHVQMQEHYWEAGSRV